MPRASHWTEDDLQALLARGQVHEVGAPAKVPPVPPTESAEARAAKLRVAEPRKSGRLLGASEGQKRYKLIAKVAAAAWCAQLAALPPLALACRVCQVVTTHQCTYAGWRCGICGAERLEEEDQCRQTTS